jgi:NAD(P) transhydrogenase subunit alpha
MRIAVLKETAPREQRVALVPESCKKLIQAGYEIGIERGAGVAAGALDEAYAAAGATVVGESLDGRSGYPEHVEGKRHRCA